MSKIIVGILILGLLFLIGGAAIGLYGWRLAEEQYYIDHQPFIRTIPVYPNAETGIAVMIIGGSLEFIAGLALFRFKKEEVEVKATSRT